VVVAVLLNAGDQLPVIPSMEVVGNPGDAAPLQMAGIEANVGIMFGVTVTFKVAVVSHCPAVGVKV